jgi:preprotein translocase subunit YajC
MNLNSIILMAPPSGANGQPASPLSYLFLPAIFIVMYFFLIRPQQKKAKEQKKFIEDLQKGSKVVTIAGIHGTINKINEDGTLSLEVSPGSYLKIERAAISQEWTANVNKAAAATPVK